MRFVLAFKTGADVEFEIPEDDLKRPPRRCSRSCRAPRWTGSEGARSCSESRRRRPRRTRGATAWTRSSSRGTRTDNQAIGAFGARGTRGRGRHRGLAPPAARRPLGDHPSATPRTATWRARCARRPTSSCERTAPRPWSRSRRPSRTRSSRSTASSSSTGRTTRLHQQGGARLSIFLNRTWDDARNGTSR